MVYEDSQVVGPGRAASSPEVTESHDLLRQIQRVALLDWLPAVWKKKVRKYTTFMIKIN